MINFPTRFASDLQANTIQVNYLLTVTTRAGKVIRVSSATFARNISHSNEFYDGLLQNEVFENRGLKIGGIKEKIDLRKNKATIGTAKVTIDNSIVNNQRFSQLVHSQDNYDILNAKIEIALISQSCREISDCPIIFTGRVTETLYGDDDTVILKAEDSFDEFIKRKNLPTEYMPDDYSTREDEKNIPIPIVYGSVNASPLVLKKHPTDPNIMFLQPDRIEYDEIEMGHINDLQVAIGKVTAHVPDVASWDRSSEGLVDVEFEVDENGNNLGFADWNQATFEGSQQWYSNGQACVLEKGFFVVYDENSNEIFSTPTNLPAHDKLQIEFKRYPTGVDVPNWYIQTEWEQVGDLDFLGDQYQLNRTGENSWFLPDYVEGTGDQITGRYTNMRVNGLWHMAYLNNEDAQTAYWAWGNFGAGNDWGYQYMYNPFAFLDEADTAGTIDRGFIGMPWSGTFKQGSNPSQRAWMTNIIYWLLRAYYDHGDIHSMESIGDTTTTVTFDPKNWWGGVSPTSDQLVNLAQQIVDQRQYKWIYKKYWPTRTEECIYGSTNQDFIEQFEETFNVGNWDTYFTPINGSPEHEEWANHPPHAWVSPYSNIQYLDGILLPTVFGSPYNYSNELNQMWADHNYDHRRGSNDANQFSTNEIGSSDAWINHRYFTRELKTADVKSKEQVPGVGDALIKTDETNYGAGEWWKWVIGEASGEPVYANNEEQKIRVGTYLPMFQDHTPDADFGFLREDAELTEFEATGLSVLQLEHQIMTTWRGLGKNTDASTYLSGNADNEIISSPTFPLTGGEDAYTRHVDQWDIRSDPMDPAINTYLGNINENQTEIMPWFTFGSQRALPISWAPPCAGSAYDISGFITSLGGFYGTEQLYDWGNLLDTENIPANWSGEHAQQQLEWSWRGFPDSNTNNYGNYMLQGNNLTGYFHPELYQAQAEMILTNANNYDGVDETGNMCGTNWRDPMDHYVGGWQMAQPCPDEQYLTVYYGGNMEILEEGMFNAWAYDPNPLPDSPESGNFAQGDGYRNRGVVRADFTFDNVNSGNILKQSTHTYIECNIETSATVQMQSGSTKFKVITYLVGDELGDVNVMYESPELTNTTDPDNPITYEIESFDVGADLFKADDGVTIFHRDPLWKNPNQKSEFVVDWTFTPIDGGDRATIAYQSEINKLCIHQYSILEKLVENKFFGNVLGRIDNNFDNGAGKYTSVNESAPLEEKAIVKPSDILMNVLCEELKWPLVFDADALATSRTLHNNMYYSFSINEDVKADEFIEKFFKDTYSIPRFKMSDNSISFITLKSNYSSADAIIEKYHVKSFKYSRTKVDDLVLKCRVLYGYNYSTKKYDHSTHPTDEGVAPINIEQYLQYYNITDIAPHYLEIKSKHIRDQETADSLAKYMVEQHKNIKLKVDLTTDMRYSHCEVGDIIKFDKLLNEKYNAGHMIVSASDDITYKPYDIDYINSGELNGQIISPYFMITEIQKTISEVKMKLIQTHELNYSNLQNINNNLDYDWDWESSGYNVTEHTLGDINMDGDVNVLDIVLGVNALVGNGELDSVFIIDGLGP